MLASKLGGHDRLPLPTARYSLGFVAHDCPCVDDFPATDAVLRLLFPYGVNPLRNGVLGRLESEDLARTVKAMSRATACGFGARGNRYRSRVNDDPAMVDDDPDLVDDDPAGGRWRPRGGR
jgi:hypothetical protein